MIGQTSHIWGLHSKAGVGPEGPRGQAKPLSPRDLVQGAHQTSLGGHQNVLPPPPAQSPNTGPPPGPAAASPRKGLSPGSQGTPVTSTSQAAHRGLGWPSWEVSLLECPPGGGGSYHEPQRPPSDTIGRMETVALVPSVFHSQGRVWEGVSTAGGDKGLGIL